MLQVPSTDFNFQLWTFNKKGAFYFHMSKKMPYICKSKKAMLRNTYCIVSQVFEKEQFFIIINLFPAYHSGNINKNLIEYEY